MRKQRLTLGLLGLISLTTSNLHADTLQDIYSMALEYDHQLRADTAAYKAGLEAEPISRANLLPQLNATASYSESTAGAEGYQSSVDRTLGYDLDNETESYSVTLSQPLFDMAAWFGYKQGKTLSQQAEAQFSADQQAFIIRVTEAYLNVLSTIDAIETAQAEETALGHQLEQSNQRFEVGLTAITDVHEAQAAFDTATATTLEAMGNLGIAFEELEVLTGHAHTQIAPLVDEFTTTPPQPEDRHDWVEFALQNNYDLKVAKFQADASQSNARAKASGHLPKITASYSYQDREDTNVEVAVAGNVVSEPDSRYNDRETFSVQLQVPLFSGLRVSSERRQAYQQQMQTEELYNQAMRNTVQGARSLHLKVMTNVAQVKARKQAITSNTSALEATQAGYEVGTRNLVDVLVAQRNLYQAQREYDNSRYEYILNLLKLKQVAGNLSPEDVLQLNRWLDKSNQVSRSEYE